MFMTRDPDAGVAVDAEEDQEVSEESWDKLDGAPIRPDPSEDFVCRACDDEVVQDDQGECFQVPRGLPEPKPPSLDVQRRHNLTHWPYAPWCPHCVMARRNDTAHQQSSNGDGRSVPLLVFDYCFVKNSNEDDLVTILVGKLYPRRRTFACRAPSWFFYFSMPGR